MLRARFFTCSATCVLAARSDAFMLHLLWMAGRLPKDVPGKSPPALRSNLKHIWTCICVEYGPVPCICQGIYVRIPSMPGRSATAPLDLLFRALADPTRLRLLNLIADRE